MERLAFESAPGADVRVGADSAPQGECVRFRTLPSLAFPPGGIHKLESAPASEEAPSTPRPELTVSLMGLFGATGVLPDHYTELLISQNRRREFALRDFLDLFNHRVLSLLHRVWEKYRVIPQVERRSLGIGTEESRFDRILWSFMGLGTPGLRNRQPISDDIAFQYAGLFSRRVRTGTDLAAMLNDYFPFAVEVQEFQGNWMFLGPEDRTRLPGGDHRSPSFNQLGVDTMLGDRVWDVQGKFRLRVGPLGYSDYMSLLPGGDVLQQVTQLTRSFVGIEMAFDVELVPEVDELPACRLGGKPPEAPRLGWNTWLHTKSSGESVNVEGAVFAHDAA
jgi:type VI secretion system protein ImpH